MFNFQKTPKTIPEVREPIITEIIDNRAKSDMMVRQGDNNIGKIYFSYKDSEWKYRSCDDYCAMLSMPFSIGQETMSLILNKLTELNEQESSVQ